MFRNHKFILLIPLLTFFLCHTGICSTVDNYFSSKNSYEASCHEVESTHNQHHESSYDPFLTYDYESKICCLDKIVDNQNSEYKNSNYAFESITYLYSAVFDNSPIYISNQANNKGHPSKKIYISNSILLI